MIKSIAELKPGGGLHRAAGIFRDRTGTTGVPDVKFPVAVDFTVFGELTVFRRQTVGGFYGSDFRRRPLTSVSGRIGGINPPGTGLAGQGGCDTAGRQEFPPCDPLFW